MKKSLLIILLIGAIGQANARINILPSDSIVLVSQFFMGEGTQSDTKNMVRYNKREVWIERFTDCLIKVPITKRICLTLDCIRGDVDGNNYKVRVTGLPKETQLSIYIPKNNSQQVYVNGKEAIFPIKNGYMKITRKWRNFNEIYIKDDTE